MNKLKNIILAILAFVLSIGVFGAIGSSAAKNSVFADETELDLNALTSFKMVNGASVYVSKTDENKTGIRFKATISSDEYNALTAKGAQFGFIIMPADYVSDPSYELTVENLFGMNSVYCFETAGHSDDCTKKHISQTLEPIITDVEGGKEISASLVGILTNNISRSFVGLAYVRIVDDTHPSVDGEIYYSYALASFEGGRMEENARSMLYIAQVAVENGEDNSDLLIANYFAPLAERNLKIKYYAFFRLFSPDGSQWITDVEPQIFTTPFSGTGLTEITAPDYNGTDERFLNATKQNPDVKYVIYNELRTTIDVIYYQNKTENPQKALTAEDINCYETPIVSINSAEDVTYLYSDSENGEYKALSEINGGKLTAGKWFVKAVIAETSYYLETTTEPVAFTVSHKLNGYRAAEAEDVPVCVCGADIADSETFKTKVTEPRQDVVLSSTDAIGISLGGVSEYDNVKSITCGGVSLGNTIGNLDVSGLSNVAHGETNIMVKVEKDGYEHVVTVPVTLITDIITDRDVLLHSIQCHSGNKTALAGEGKYYVLGDDIEVGNVNSHTFGGATYTSTYSYDINAQIGFAGTLDGRGHSLNGVISDGTSGIFGFVNGATIKNLNISFDSYKGSCIFGYYVISANVSDVNIMINTPIDNTSSEDVGLLAHNQAKECKFTNLVIHAEGSSLRQLTSKGWLGYYCTYTDCVIYAKDYKNSAATATNLPGGLTFTSTEAVKNAYVELSSDTFDITLPESFNGYTVESVSINETLVLSSLTELSTDCVSSFALGAETPVVITLKNDVVSFKVKTNVVVVTKVITAWNELLYFVGYRSGLGADFRKGDYYVLGNDIVGGNPENGFIYDDTSYGATETAFDASYNSPYNADYALVGGFAGTLDGAGYTISNIDVTYFSIFGTINGGTVKNLNMEVTMWSWGNAGVFGGAGDIYDATIENVSVKISKDSVVNRGIISKNHMGKCVINNLTIHAEGLDLQYLLSNSPTGANTSASNGNRNIYSNIKVYANDYTYCASTSGGVTWANEGWLYFYKDRQEIVLDGDTVSVALPTALANSGYYCYRVKLNGKEITSGTIEGHTASYGGTAYNAIDMSALSVEQIKAAIGTTYGDYNIEFTISEDSSPNAGYVGWVIPVKFVAPSSDTAAE